MDALTTAQKTAVTKSSTDRLRLLLMRSTKSTESTESAARRPRSTHGRLRVDCKSTVSASQ